MAIQHRDITDPEIHEPKGVVIAPTGSFLSASSGVSTWAFPNYSLTLQIPTLTGAANYWIAALHNGYLTTITAIINGAIGTANTTITPNIGGVDVLTGVVTIPFAGSAAGNVVTVSPSAGNAVTANQGIQFKVNGASSGGVSCTLSLLFRRTA